MSSNGLNHRSRVWVLLSLVLPAAPLLGDPGPYPHGACCHWPSGACEAAVKLSANLYCCNGVCQTTEFPGACSGNESCYIYGDCDVMDGYCCYYFGGDGISGDDCNENEVHDNCDLEGNDCQPNGQPDECDTDCNGNDTPDDCEAREACCKADGSCQYLPADCCAGVDGVPGGVGTSCSGTPDLLCGIPWACCTPEDGAGSIPFCENVKFHFCVTAHDGTPQGPNADCKGLLIPNPDNDGVPSACDNCPNDYNPDQVDDDDDTVGDVCDNCNPSNPTHHCNATGFTCPNPTQTDTDSDGVGNACDNCPNHSNSNQVNCDGDLYGNICDIDIDGDGVNNMYDVCDYTPAGVAVITTTGHKLRGTIHGDVDGDCDRDQSDLNQMPVTGPACPGGTFDANCPGGGGGGSQQ